jgi:RNA 3'-terminal phosphate cyclase (ATP)
VIRSLAIDGSYGEGGGQILRTSLGLSVALGRPVTVTHVRARRAKPGLQPQHLAVVRALATIGDAEVAGDHLGSTEIHFAPRTLRPGQYRFDVAAAKPSAGSVCLLFQSLLLALGRARAPSQLTLLGGTHLPWSPPFHYLALVFLPALRGIGVVADVDLRRWGWYPAGGGEIVARIGPADHFNGFVPASRPPTAISGLSAVSRLPPSIAERQRGRAEERLRSLGLPLTIAVEEDQSARGPGTVLFLSVPGRAGFTALGRRGLPAERVADAAVDELLEWLRSGADVDDHLADQLVPFLALASAPSCYTCSTVSPHLRTVAWVVEQFLPVRVRLDEVRPARVEITPGSDLG